MRYELSDTEWGAIRVMLPNKLAALPAWMIGVFSMASSGYYGRAPRGAIFRTSTPLPCNCPALRAGGHTDAEAGQSGLLFRDEAGSVIGGFLSAHSHRLLWMHYAAASVGCSRTMLQRTI